MVIAAIETSVYTLYEIILPFISTSHYVHKISKHSKHKQKSDKIRLVLRNQLIMVNYHIDVIAFQYVRCYLSMDDQMF